MKYDKPLIRLIHDYGQYARIHAHGKVKTVLKYMMDMETDATDPVEAPISGDLTLAEAKEICGNRMVLFGNIQQDLETLPPERMRDGEALCGRRKAGRQFCSPTYSYPSQCTIVKKNRGKLPYIH